MTEQSVTDCLCVGINKKLQVFMTEAELNFKEFFDLKQIYEESSLRKIEGKVWKFGDFILRIGILCLG